MHKTVLTPAIVEKVIQRRGRKHVFSDLDPRSTALLVVDMQAIYLDPDVAPSDFFYGAHYREIVPNINLIAQTLRQTGGTVVWIANTATPESQRSWSVLNERMLSAQSRKEREDAYREGSKGGALWKGFDVNEGDLKIRKTRFSAFIQGASDLEHQLRERNIDTVIVTGVGTGTCCDSTARDAMMLNFATIMVSDANACATDEEHNAALTAFYRHFGDVMSTEELLVYVKANAPR